MTLEETNAGPDLNGKVALVTGGGRGIGRAIALALAARGAHAFIAARSEDQLEEVAREARDRATPVPADVASEEDVLRLFSRIREEKGRLDILINNAGIGAFGPVAEFDVGELDRVLAVNLRGTFLCCREALRIMAPRRSGYIINIASVVGFKGYPDQGAYTASKHGIVGLTKTLAIEAQEYGIRVSVLSPGGVDTELIGRARPDLDRSTLLKPQDIARTVLFLLGLPERAAIDEIYIRRSASTPW